MSAKKAVKALELIINDIKRDGLFIGHKGNSYAAMEEFGPRPKDVDVDRDRWPRPNLLKVS
jgi:hypothetical protein